MDNENMQQEDIKSVNKSGGQAWIMLAVLVVVGGYFLYSQSRSGTVVAPVTTESDSATATTQVSGSADTMMENQVKEFTLDTANFSYSPNVISVKKGDKVKVTIRTDEEKKMHDFTLDEFNVQSDTAKKDEPVTVEFVADKVGEFEFYCSVMDHRAKGQVGTLIVTE